MINTGDILNLFKEKFKNKDFRQNGNAVQESTTIELQHIQFEVDKPWIVREPNYAYFKNELEWYKSMSLNVNDIPGNTPIMWKKCASIKGEINSNYGWMIFSEENCYQFEHCLHKLIEDPYTREACMIYNRPSMQYEYNKNFAHDFCCTYAVQCFLNKDNDNKFHLKYIVYMRSNDAVFGFNNDSLWHIYVQNLLGERLEEELKIEIIRDKIIWNVGSLHIYKKHFKYLEENNG